MPGCACAKDQPLEQGIAGQAIRAVNPGTSHLARGIEPGDGSLPIEVGANPAHRVVGRRAYRHQFGRDVDVVSHAGGVNRGEASAHTVGMKMRQVEIDRCVGPCCNFQLMRNRAGDHIARSQFGQLVILRHEALQLEVAEVGAFATQRFRQQKPRSVLQDTAPWDGTAQTPYR